MKLQLPLKTGTQQAEKINFDERLNTLVIIGANGSGKTRFGSYLEENYKHGFPIQGNRSFIHRISAQKSLSMPRFTSTVNGEKAESDFLYGIWDEKDNSWTKQKGWKQIRWNSNLNTHLLNDFDKLMTLLHTEEYETLLRNSKINSQSETKLDSIIKIWQEVIPHRTLEKKAGEIQVLMGGDQDYNGADMSDGERVIFYLIGQAICAPHKATIIFDEPEMHIHRSLVKKLFDLIEQARSDCYFIYLTHDIDFAFTRQKSKKIWMKSYNGNNEWDYEILDDEHDIPQQLYFELLGSRKPILFLEGDESSFDYKLYEHLFSEYTVKPLGGCPKVIQTVKSFNEQSEFHHNEAFGLIDRDRKNQEEIDSYLNKNIWVLDVVEIENLFLIEGVIRLIAEHQAKQNIDEIIQQVKDNVLKFFQEQLDNQVIIHFKHILSKEYRKLYEFEKKNKDEIISEIDELFNQTNKEEIFDEIKTRFTTIIDDNDYDSVLKVLNNKGGIAHSKVLNLLGINNQNDYMNLVINLIKSKSSTGESLKSVMISNILRVSIS